MKEKDATAIVSVVVIPRNQFRFQYRLNDGKSHTIAKHDAFEYFKQFIETNNYVRLIELLQTFSPFIIIVPDNYIEEFLKEDDTTEYYKQNLKNEIDTVSKKGVKKTTENPEHIQNDNLLTKLSKKFIKK